MKPLDEINDPRMVKALAHPLRLRIIDALENRSASPSELSQELGAPIGNVSYHVRRLESLGVLELVDTAQRRGAVEHYFRLVSRPRVSEKAWASAPGIVKEAMLQGVLSKVGEQVTAAAANGGFTRPETHVGRLPMLLDEQGFKEAASVLSSVAERLSTIQEKSAKRLEKADHEGELHALAVLMLFEAENGRNGKAGKGHAARGRGTRQKSAAGNRRGR